MNTKAIKLNVDKVRAALLYALQRIQDGKPVTPKAIEDAMTAQGHKNAYEGVNLLIQIADTLRGGGTAQRDRAEAIRLEMLKGLPFKDKDEFNALSPEERKEWATKLTEAQWRALAGAWRLRGPVYARGESDGKEENGSPA